MALIIWLPVSALVSSPQPALPESPTVVTSVVKPLKPLKAPQEAVRPQIKPVYVPKPKPAPAAPTQPTGTISGCGDNSYAHYIYMHESSCQLHEVTGNCDGIGQACPASKIYNACPGMDYACQNAFFTSYANSRYGGWEAAYGFWLANHWW